MRPMHAVMISFDSALASPASEAYARHRAYAVLAGRLTIIAPGAGQRIVDGPLTVIPVASSRIGLPAAAAAAAEQAVHASGKSADLIITQDLFLTGVAGVRLRGRLNAPLLVQDHSTVLDNPDWMAEHPLRNRGLALMARWVIGRSDFVRVVNQASRHAFLRRNFPAERVAALPLATASTAFAEPLPSDVLRAKRAELGIPDDAPVVLWVGYPVPFKRAPMLLIAFALAREEIPDARLLFVGDLARSKQNLPALATSIGLKDHAIFTGRVPHADLPTYYQLADLYVLTSAYEGVPRVLMEAAAAGLPLLASGRGGVTEIVRAGETGVYLPEHEDLGHQFADQIVALLRDPEKRAQYGAAAQKLALSEFNADDYPPRWVALWEQAVALGRRA
ncbi:MAG: glycosyltransferase family 4 protein [Anaerolineae bacterium]